MLSRLPPPRRSPASNDGCSWGLHICSIAPSSTQNLGLLPYDLIGDASQGMWLATSSLNTCRKPGALRCLWRNTSGMENMPYSSAMRRLPTSTVLEEQLRQQGHLGGRGPGRRLQALKALVELDRDSKLFTSKMLREKGSLNEWIVHYFGYNIHRGRPTTRQTAVSWVPNKTHHTLMVSTVTIFLRILVMLLIKTVLLKCQPNVIL